MGFAAGKGYLRFGAAAAGRLDSRLLRVGTKLLRPPRRADLFLFRIGGFFQQEMGWVTARPGVMGRWCGLFLFVYYMYVSWGDG